MTDTKKTHGAEFASTESANTDIFGKTLVGELLTSDDMALIGGGDGYDGTWSCGGGSSSYYQSGGSTYGQSGGTFSQTGGSYSMRC